MRKILQLTTRNEGYDQIRIINPLVKIIDNLKEQNIIVETLPIDEINLNIANKFDVLNIHGVFSVNLLNLLRKIRFNLWIDDLMWDLPACNPANPTSTELMAFEWGVKNAHRVIATTPQLAQELTKDFGITPLIANNYIDLEHKDNKSDNVLFVGGNSHGQDIRLVDYTGDRNLIFFGMLPPRYANCEIFEKGNISITPNKKNIGYIPITTNYEQYNVWLNNTEFGVGICPLVESRFNSCKSILKFLEYASRGAISVVSPVMPYNIIPYDCKVETINNNWTEAIEYAFTNRQKVYENAYEYTKYNWSWAAGTAQWRQVYEQL